MDGVRTVAVAGLGLIGGSVARDLARRGVRVLGWDRDAATVAAAREEGVVSAALGDGLAGVEDADVLLLALPVLAAPAVLESALPRLARVRLVTDAGSTKSSIVAAAERLGIGERFVGAHPLAGSHESGWTASREGLFAGATVYLCPTPSSSADAVEETHALWSALGGRTVEIDAAEHDRRLAWTSHLPQALSTALAAALAEQGIARGELGPGGRDMTRLAGSSPAMWADILGDNRDAIVDTLQKMEDQIRTLRFGIGRRDGEDARKMLETAKSWHDEVNR
jgi:prephenate dehydrogenase